MVGRDLTSNTIRKNESRKKNKQFLSIQLIFFNFYRKIERRKNTKFPIYTLKVIEKPPTKNKQREQIQTEINQGKKILKTDR